MARTRGKDSLGPARRQGGRRRRIVHVFTEGRVTEPTYIEIIRDRGIRADPAVVVEVRIANAGAPGSQRKPVKLVGAAARLMREETRAAKRGGLKKEFWPQVWCLFDRDEHDCVDAALKQAGEAGGGRLLAPLLRGVAAAAPQAGDRHLRRSLRSGRGTLPFAASTANIKVVTPAELPEGSFSEARKRALRMNAAHGDHVPKSKRDPYTDVFAFVESGLGIDSH